MKIAIWYHCLLSGPRLVSPDHAVGVMHTQMQALQNSGLLAQARELHIGINGSESDLLLASALAPVSHRPNSFYFKNHPQGESELSTLRDLQAWLKPGWFVLYHHIKGVQYPGNPVWENWRRCMERVVVWDWQECLRTIIGGGFDTVGAHWMSHEKYSMIHPSQRYWGGNFWWATSEYLMTLPPLPLDSFAARYDAEVWIGSGPRRPFVFDFAPHWPMSCTL